MIRGTLEKEEEQYMARYVPLGFIACNDFDSQGNSIVNYAAMNVSLGSQALGMAAVKQVLTPAKESSDYRALNRMNQWSVFAPKPLPRIRLLNLIVRGLNRIELWGSIKANPPHLAARIVLPRDCITTQYRTCCSVEVCTRHKARSEQILPSANLAVSPG